MIQAINNKTHAIQLRCDFYDIINNPKVKELYPNLYHEVLQQTKQSTSSWYELSEKAAVEYQAYYNNHDIGYIR